MVEVQVAIATGPDEFADVEISLLGDQMRQQSVRGDIERYPEEYIGAALIELARELPVPASDVELKERVARRQAHARYIRDVPRRHDESARIGILSNLLDHAR